MTRTARRPIPDGKVSRAEALGFGLALACSAVAVFALAVNVAAAALLAFAIFIYIAVYTVCRSGGRLRTLSSVVPRALFHR
jgi:protoheme IX farnesyltransferase